MTASTIFGFIAAITTASIYGSKAVAMRKAIERIEGLIKKDEEILKADVAIDGDLTRMKVNQNLSLAAFSNY